LIKAAVKARYGWDRPVDIFEEVQDAVLMAVSDGAITIPKAEQLRFALMRQLQHGFFPYSTLQVALSRALCPNAWSPEIERDLLIFLTAVFGSDDSHFAYADLVREHLPTLGCIFDQLFDSAPEGFSLDAKLCDFTGSFEGKSRRECYELVAANGGIASDGGWYTDCFFVAEEHYRERVISSGLASSIIARARYGVTRIYRESVFRYSCN